MERNETKHTMGPWVVLPEEVDRPYIRIRGTVLGCRYKIANVVTPTYDGVSERDAEQTRANARLIAAAPTLLEALQRLDQCGHTQATWDFAKRAIALATSANLKEPQQ
jgi:hypothetical protein